MQGLLTLMTARGSNPQGPGFKRLMFVSGHVLAYRKLTNYKAWDAFKLPAAKKKKRPKSTNVSKFQVAAAAHEACRSSQKDFLCLLFFNHRALARLIACCSSIGPLFQLLLGDVLEEANASPKL